MTKEEVSTAKEIAILGYLQARGVPTKKAGNAYLCSSPFRRDQNWSFAIYPKSNTFYDFGDGNHGDIIQLVENLEGLTFIEAIEQLLGSTITKTTEPEYEQYLFIPDKKKFNWTKYINLNSQEIKDTKEYAKQRRINEQFLCGVFFKRIDDKPGWARFPSIMFLHKNEEQQIIGAKFRALSNEQDLRFSSRGTLGWYILDCLNEESLLDPTIYIVEGETSANSLYSHLKETNENFAVLSAGGVTRVPNYLPNKYKKIEDVRIIIDYDGDEELFQQRGDKYEVYNGKLIRMILPKGEDINSLYVKREMYKVDNLL